MCLNSGGDDNGQNFNIKNLFYRENDKRVLRYSIKRTPVFLVGGDIWS